MSPYFVQSSHRAGKCVFWDNHIGDVENSLGEFFVSLEYRLFEHFAVGVTFDRLILNLDYKSGKRNGREDGDGFRPDFTWQENSKRIEGGKNEFSRK